MNHYIVKGIIVLFLFMVLFSLFSALFYLVRGQKGSTQVVKALTWRIGLSLLLFVLLLIAFALGWITPH